MIDCEKKDTQTSALKNLPSLSIIFFLALGMRALSLTTYQQPHQQQGT